jgi:hypothetical protein
MSARQWHALGLIQTVAGSTADSAANAARIAMLEQLLNELAAPTNSFSISSGSAFSAANLTPLAVPSTPTALAQDPFASLIKLSAAQRAVTALATPASPSSAATSVFALNNPGPSLSLLSRPLSVRGAPSNSGSPMVALARSSGTPTVGTPTASSVAAPVVKRLADAATELDTGLAHAVDCDAERGRTPSSPPLPPMVLVDKPDDEPNAKRAKLEL